MSVNIIKKEPPRLLIKTLMVIYATALYAFNEENPLEEILVALLPLIFPQFFNFLAKITL